MDWLTRLAQVLGRAKRLTAAVGLTIVALATVIVQSDMSSTHKWGLLSVLLAFVPMLVLNALRADGTTRRRDGG